MTNYVFYHFICTIICYQKYTCYNLKTMIYLTRKYINLNGYFVPILKRLLKTFFKMIIFSPVSKLDAAIWPVKCSLSMKFLLHVVSAQTFRCYISIGDQCPIKCVWCEVRKPIELVNCIFFLFFIGDPIGPKDSANSEKYEV